MDVIFRLSSAQERLVATLDDLEIQMLKLLWRHGACNVRQIHAQLSERSRPDFLTVMSSLSRLIGAGLLMPEAPPRGLSYNYRPTLSCDEFITSCGALINANLRTQLYPTLGLPPDQLLRERSIGL